MSVALKENIQQFTSASEKETIAFGRRFAEQLNAGDVVALRGDLGSGKTYFVKGVAAGFGIDKQRVSSPTFSLIQEYSGRLPLYHFDCYRLKSVREAVEIGAQEYFYGTGVCLIEWAERIIPILPEETIWIDLKTKGPNLRQFIMRKKNC